MGIGYCRSKKDIHENIISILYNYNERHSILYPGNTKEGYMWEKGIYLERLPGIAFTAICTIENIKGCRELEVLQNTK